MDGLLEKKVAGLAKHPVAELARLELAKGCMVNDADVPGLPVCALAHIPCQTKKSRMEYKILVYARRYGGGRRFYKGSTLRIRNT